MKLNIEEDVVQEWKGIFGLMWKKKQPKNGKYVRSVILMKCNRILLD